MIVFNNASVFALMMKRAILILKSVVAVIEIILNLLEGMGNVRYIVRKNVLARFRFIGNNEIPPSQLT